MLYTFEILGTAPVLHFFNHQQAVEHSPASSGVAYLGSFQCTLDALIESVEAIAPHRPWKLDRAIDTVIQFWMHNADRVSYWKQRLHDAGGQTLLVSRLADVPSLQAEFELLFGRI